MIWYSHLFKNLPQFVVVHTVKGFRVVNEAEVDVFLEFLCFSYDPTDVGNLAYIKSTLSCWINEPEVDIFSGIPLLLL